MTHVDAIPDRIRHDLAPLLGKYLGVPSDYVSEEIHHTSHHFKHEAAATCPHRTCSSMHIYVLLGAVIAYGIFRHRSAFFN